MDVQRGQMGAQRRPRMRGAWSDRPEMCIGRTDGCPESESFDDYHIIPVCWKPETLLLSTVTSNRATNMS